MHIFMHSEFFATDRPCGIHNEEIRELEGQRNSHYVNSSNLR